METSANERPRTQTEPITCGDAPLQYHVASSLISRQVAAQ